MLRVLGVSPFGTQVREWLDGVRTDLPASDSAAESVQVCKWLVEAGVDAIHASTGGCFPHPQNPAGSDLPVSDLVRPREAMIAEIMSVFSPPPFV